MTEAEREINSELLCDSIDSLEEEKTTHVVNSIASLTLITASGDPYSADKQPYL